MLKEGPIYVNYDRSISSPFAAKTWPERVEIKNQTGYPSELGGAAPSAFIQKGYNSNLEIPG